MAGMVGVAELLEQMQRRARAVGETPSVPAEPVTTAGSPNGRDRQSLPDEHSTPMARHPRPATGDRSVPPAPASDGARAAQRTMVQQPDGSWEPLHTVAQDDPVPPPPWEQSDHREEPHMDEGNGGRPSMPGPQDGRLFGDEELS